MPLSTSRIKPSIAPVTDTINTSDAFDLALWPSLASAIDGQVAAMIALRREIHANPEASGREFATTQLIAERLTHAGLHPRVMRDGLGVMTDISLGAPADRFIAIRAELDSVGVDEGKTVAYASKNPGLCHACGHDAHSTIAVAVATTIHQHREQLAKAGLKHNIRAIFQPAEETATGARSMIEQGALENVQGILSLHVEPFTEVGLIGLRAGPLTSSCKSFEIVIHGKSGHSARPFQAIDPIQAATSVIDLFYQLGPRSMDSRYPLSLTVGSVHAGAAFNAIPDEAVIRGTLRTARLEDEQAVERKMLAVLRGVEHATGCTITIEYPVYAPATHNDAALIDIMARSAKDLLGPDSLRWLDVPSLGAEDFAFYQQRIPGAIVRLGAAMSDPAGRMPLHSSFFDIDERALGIGAKLLMRSALMAAAKV